MDGLMAKAAIWSDKSFAKQRTAIGCFSVAAITLASLMTAPVAAQAPSGGYAQPPAKNSQNLTPAQQHQLAQQRAARQRAQQQAAAADNGRQAAANAPFAPLSAQQEQQLTEVLQKWETQSKQIERLECGFTRWRYDNTEAPAGTHSTWARGEIRYAAPDKGVFKVNDLKFYKGEADGKKQYDSIAGRNGEHWVCDGKQLLDFDHDKKVCTIQELPPEMQGKQIFESPLPFVFNLDAQRIRERYWVRLKPSPTEGTYLVEAWPKRQQDRAQYRLVQIVVNGRSFLPVGLRMYAPNFDEQKAPNFDHYQFSNVKANSMLSGVTNFLDRFIEKPDSSWTIIRERWQPNEAQPKPKLQQAQVPGNQPR